MKKLGMWIGGLIVVAIIVVACSGGRPASTSSNVGPLSTAPAVVTANVAPPVVVSTPSGPATAVGDGTYEVGPDLVAGKYKTPGSGGEGVMNGCYWKRSNDGSGTDIIANDNFNGPATITVKVGEYLKLSGGCKWSKS